jgi:succinate-acetate transporter protein
MADLEKGATTTATASGINHHTHNVYGDNTTPALRNSVTSSVKNNIANPAGLGLFSFASTTLILSLYNVSARGVNVPNAVVGMALFCGGLAQLLAGMWEFPKGNTFGATAFSSYGAFWLSYATLLIPGSGIADAYGTNDAEFTSAIGIYLMTWMTVTFLLFIASLRKNIGFIGLFMFLTLTFMMLGASNFVLANGNVTTAGHLQKAGGALGIITALIAYYVGLSEILAAERAAVVGLPLGVFKHD